MVVIRPILPSDLDGLLSLAQQAGVGVTSLPADRDLLAARIELSNRSFAKQCPQEHANYLFALIDEETQDLLGVSAIEACVGSDDSWYNYRVGKAVHASKALDIYAVNEVLYLSNDLTGSTELCTLFLNKAKRQKHFGRMLSKCRFLFIQEFETYFAQKIIAEMRGYSDEKGESPFWEALGRHFFQMDFQRADLLTVSGNKAFVAELMPKHPIYSYLLPESAIECIAKVHDKTQPALGMLKEEGFRYNGFIDIFDAGPIVEAFTSAIYSIRHSFMVELNSTDDHEAQMDANQMAHKLLLYNRRFEDMRMICIDSPEAQPKSLLLDEDQLGALGVKAGDVVRALRLKF